MIRSMYLVLYFAIACMALGSMQDEQLKIECCAGLSYEHVSIESNDTRLALPDTSSYGQAHFVRLDTE